MLIIVLHSFDPGDNHLRVFFVEHAGAFTRDEMNDPPRGSLDENSSR